MKRDKKKKKNLWLRKICGLQILFTVIDFCIETGKNSIFKTRHIRGYDRENVSISSQ